jgi:hypothetical protein
MLSEKEKGDRYCAMIGEEMAMLDDPLWEQKNWERKQRAAEAEAAFMEKLEEEARCWTPRHNIDRIMMRQREEECEDRGDTAGANRWRRNIRKQDDDFDRCYLGSNDGGTE